MGHSRSRFLTFYMNLTVFSGKQEAAEAILAALEVVPEPLRSMANLLVEVCAYAGTCAIFI